MGWMKCAVTPGTGRKKTHPALETEQKGRVAKRASMKNNESVSPKGLADSLFCVKMSYAYTNNAKPV